MQCHRAASHHLMSNNCKFLNFSKMSKAVAFCLEVIKAMGNQFLKAFF